MRALIAAVALGLVHTPAAAVQRTVDAGEVTITEMARGLEEPWAVGFLPDGGWLVTERDGALVLFRADGSRQDVAGLPEVAAVGQGGLLDLLVPRDFAQSREIFLSYATRQGRGAGTALGVGRLSADGARLDGFRTIFEMAEGSRGGVHFGSRMVEAPDGTIFLTIGERGAKTPAQDVTRHEGSVVHLNRDGSPASPGLFGAGAQPDLYSKGHRNPQGAALDAEGRLWVVEHGARGGDEVNLVQPGRNYGWPVISYGRNYNGLRIGEGTAKEGMEQPAFYWDPSIAPSGMMIYQGDMFPEWQGDVFTGSLKFDLISRLDPDEGWAEERMDTPETQRVRDIREAPDGSIWFLSVGNGAVYRISR